MTTAESQVLRAAIALAGGQPQLVEFRPLAEQSGLPESQARAAAISLRSRGLCIMTFGGIQLTQSGLNAAAHA